MCGAKKLQGLNLIANPKLYFAGKLSYRDANQPICKGGLLAIHHSGAWGWPHRPGAQSYMLHHKLSLLTLNISLLLLLNVVIQNHTVSPFYWPFQRLNNSVIPQNLGNI